MCWLRVIERYDHRLKRCWKRFYYDTSASLQRAGLRDPPTSLGDGFMNRNASAFSLRKQQANPAADVTNVRGFSSIFTELVGGRSPLIHYLINQKGRNMKAILARKYGNPDVLTLEEVGQPTPEGNQVLVKIHAAATNPAYWHRMEGKIPMLRQMYGDPQPTDPYILTGRNR